MYLWHVSALLKYLVRRLARPNKLGSVRSRQGPIPSLCVRKVAAPSDAPFAVRRPVVSPLYVFHAVRKGAFGVRVRSQRAIHLVCRTADSPRTEVGPIQLILLYHFRFYYSTPIVLLSAFYTTQTPRPRRVLSDIICHFFDFLSLLSSCLKLKMLDILLHADNFEALLFGPCDPSDTQNERFPNASIAN